MPASNVPWAPLLTRFKTLMPGQPGVPGTDNTTGLRLDTNGVIFYVDPNAPGVYDSRDGTDPEGPLATVTKALTLCRAYRNDTIIVAPSSYWTHANTAAGRPLPVREEVIVSTPGVRIVGLMPSASLGVPWLVTQNGGVAITVNAMSVLIEGFNFWEDTYTTPIAIDAYWDGTDAWGDNVVIRNNFFGDGLDHGIRLDFSYNTHIHNNTFQDIATTAILSLDVEGDPDYCFIYNNRFNNNAEAIVLEDSSACMIYDNLISGDGTGTNNFIDLTGGSNNLVANNYLGCTIAQYDVVCSDATSGAWVGNHATNGLITAPPI